jgi:predicted dehydrogenase
MKVVIIGTGVYVSGRGTTGFGTILPAIIEFKRCGGNIEEIHMVGTDKNHSIKAKEKAHDLMKLTGVSIPLKVYPENVQQDMNAYKHVLKMIEEPACAIVAVPDHLHFEITKTCLEHNLHSLVVKPFTSGIDEAHKLIKLAQQNNLYGAVEFHKRWDKQNLILKDTLADGQLGDPLYAVVEYSQRKSIPTVTFKHWAEKTNILNYLGVHYIDLMHFVSGSIPIRTMAMGQKNWLRSKNLNTYDSIQCFIEWEMIDGKRFNQTIIVNWIDPETSTAMSDQKFKLIGTLGRFEADQKDRGISLIVDDHNLEIINPDFCKSYTSDNGKMLWQGYGIDSITTFLNDVCSIYKGQKEPIDFEGFRPTFKEAVISTAVIEAAGKSLEDSGNWKAVEGLL